MKKIKVEEAVGKKLCHDITEMKDGFKGAAFKRGHIIKQEDLARLLDIGKKNIYIWEPGKNEIHEEEAALRLSQAIQVDGASYTKPSEGKVVLKAESRGLFKVDKKLLKDVNSITDVTISSIPGNYPVEIGERLASMRIIPLVTDEKNIEEAENILKNKKLFDLIKYQEKKVGLIITGSEIYTGRIKDKFEPVVRKKLEKYPSDLIGVKICDDEMEMIRSSAKELIEKGAQILIFAGGMSVDPDDLTPDAIKELGADIVSYGVPAQPGNMTLIAYLGEVAIIGVPGAAISLPTTIFDVFLPQLFTGEKITKDDTLALASGGLCQMCKSCHYPNCTFGRY